MKIVKTAIISLLVLGWPLRAGDQYITIIINDHEYQVPDPISEAIILAIDDKVQQLEDGTDDDYSPTLESTFEYLTSGDFKSLEYKAHATNPDWTTLVITKEARSQNRTMYTLWIKHMVKWTYIFEADLSFDMVPQKGLVATLESFRLASVDYKNDSTGPFSFIINFIFDQWGLTNVYSHWINEIIVKAGGIDIVPFLQAGGLSPAFTLPVVDFFNNSANGYAGDDENMDAAAVIRSLPIDVSASYKLVSSTNTALVINLAIMDSYYTDNDNPGSYVTVNPYSDHDPTIVPGQVDYTGISMTADPFKYISLAPHNDTPWKPNVDQWHQEMQNRDQNIERIEAIWKYVAPVLTAADTTGLTPLSSVPQELLDDLVDNYSDLIQNKWNGDPDSKDGWYWLDYVVNSAYSRGIAPVLLLGNGPRTPLFEISPGVYAQIAPGQVRGTAQQNHIAVSEDVYLYYLELYARAVVRRYQGQVDLWQAENEINAARFTEVYDWWRKGKSWTDESVGGFQDQVVQLLYNVVHEDDNAKSSLTPPGTPNAQVIQDFHLLNMARCLAQWENYYDIVGVNVYPNQFNAYPVFGFAVGEMVWAAKRALTALGTPNKPVWLMETGYGVYFETETVSESIRADLSANLQYYNQGRQAQFLADAIESADKYGAEAFLWYRLADENVPGEIDRSLGLWRDDGAGSRMALETYRDYAEDTQNLALVNLSNEHLASSQDLGGFLAVDDAFSSVPSGGSVRLEKVLSYTVRNREERMAYSGTTVKQKQWNITESEFQNKHVFYPINEEERDQTAQYKETGTVNFAISIQAEFPDGVQYIEVRDPWYEDGRRQQRNLFEPLWQTTGNSTYEFFENQNPTNDDALPIYSIRMPQRYYTTESTIWGFKRWKAYEPDGTTEDTQGNWVDFVTDATDHTDCKIVVKQPGAVIKAIYIAENLESGEDFRIKVAYGEELLIPPGASIDMAEAVLIDVDGGVFTAEGTEDEPIRLGLTDPGGSGWGGIQLQSGNSSVRLVNTEIRYADAVVKYYAITSGSPELYLAYNTIRDCNYFIRSLDSGDEFIDSILWNNVEDAIVEIKWEDPYLSRNIFKNCVVSLNYNNDNTNNPNVTFNIFDSCYLTFGDGGNAFVRNNIFYKCDVVPDIVDFQFKYNDFYNCTFPPGVQFGTGNIYDDPNFVDAATGDYRLKWPSPCIDAGDIDVNSNDPDGTRADMGVLYHPHFFVSGPIG